MRRQRHRRDRAGGPELTAASLEARLAALQDELQRIEAALGELRRPAGGPQPEA